MQCVKILENVVKSKSLLTFYFLPLMAKEYTGMNNLMHDEILVEILI